jgi:hypothetical protein
MLGSMSVPGHQSIYSGDEGLRHHLCLSHDEHRDQGADPAEMERWHEDEHGYNPAHRGEYGCPEHTHEDEPGEFHDMGGTGEIHRGIGVMLPDETHRAVHDESRPAHERAGALLDHLTQPENRYGGQLGRHWSTNSGVAEDFAETAAKWARDEDDRARPAEDRSWGSHVEDDADEPYTVRHAKPGTAVVFHAHEPDLADIDNDPDQSEGMVYGHSEHGEREVPLRHHADVRLRGVSWAPMHDESDPDAPIWPEYSHHDFEDERERHTASVTASVAATAAAPGLAGHFEASAPSVTERAPALSHDGPDEPPADGDGGWGGGGGGENRFTVIRNGPNYGLVNDSDGPKGYVGYHESLEDAVHHLAHMKSEGTFDPSEVRYAGKTDYKRTRDITPEFHNHYSRWFEPRSAAYKPHSDVIGAGSDMSAEELAEHARTWHGNLPLDQSKRHAKDPARQHQADHYRNQGASFERGAHADACPSSWGGWVHHAGNCAYRGPSGHEHAPSMKDMFPSGSDDLLGHFEGAATPEHETWYHLTDNPHFALSTEHEPEDNSFSIEDRSGQKGVYLGKDPSHWFSAAGEGYARPYLAEFHVHPSVKDAPEVHGRWGGEMFVPAHHFDKLHLHRVIPTDAYVREQYGAHGWIEGHHGSEFDTRGPLRQNPDNRHYPFKPKWNDPSAYQYPGPDVRDMAPEQHDWHRDRWLSYLKEDRGFSDEDAAGFREQHDSHHEAARRPGRGEKTCPCCKGEGSHGDGSECDPCDGSGMMHSNDPDVICPGQPQPKRRHWRQGSAEEDEPDYWHVSPHRLPMGTVLKPGVHGRGNFDESTGTHVHMTSNEDRAEQYRYMLWEQGHPEQHMYQVRPHGPVEPDPDDSEAVRTQHPVSVEWSRDPDVTESDWFEPKTAAARTRWYHGTNDDLAAGDVVRPAAEIGRATRGGPGDETRVWVSSDPYRAFSYGSRLYEVDPSERPRHTRGPADEHDVPSATVVREMGDQEARSLSPSYQQQAAAYERTRREASTEEHDPKPLEGGMTHEAAGEQIDLYHHTSPDAAAKIYREKRMTSKENTGSIFFTTDPESEYAAGFGDGVVHVRMPRAHLESLDERGKAWQDDEFPSGEQHWAIHHTGLRPEHFVDPGVGSREAAGPDDYGIAHRPNEEGPPLHDLLDGGMMPKDFYDRMHEYNHYQHDPGPLGDAAYDAMSKIRKFRGQPEKKVRIWRSAPSQNPESRNAKHGEINNGDWVGLSRNKALAESYEVNDPSSGSLPANHPSRYHIWSALVPAKHVRNPDGDMTEWGYWGPDVKGIPHNSETCSHRARVKPPEQREAAVAPRSGSRQQEGDERSYGDYTMRYRTDDLGESKPRHVIETFHPDGSKVGRLDWYGTTGRVNKIEVADENDDGRQKQRPFGNGQDHGRRGIATAMWDWSQEMTPKTKHSGDQSDQGKAWVKSLKGPRKEPPALSAAAAAPVAEIVAHFEAGMGERVASRALDNPHTGGDEWYHGSPWRFGGFEGDAPHSGLGYEDDSSDTSHWNGQLGHHFAASHGVAEGFSKGEHSAAPEGSYEDQEPAQNVLHARLGIRNPKAYGSEHDMDQEVYEHEFRAGNHHDAHHPQGELEEAREGGWEDELPHTYQYAGHGDRMRSRDEADPVYWNVHRTYHPYATGWLNTHPDKYDIARRHRQRLIDAGHDGITYGNEFEGEQIGRGDHHLVSAIPFHGDQIDVTQRHHADAPCVARDDAERQWPGRNQPMLPGLGEHEASADVIAHFTTTGAWMQQKLFHAQPDPSRNPPESKRYNPNDPDQHLHWRSKNDEDYEPDSCPECGVDQRLNEKHIDEDHEDGLHSRRGPEDPRVPLYHGSNKPFQAGDQIEAGHPGNFTDEPLGHVYMTEQAEGSDAYKGARGYGRHVYEVTPTGPYGRRSDARGVEWASQDPLRILREVPDPRSGHQATAIIAHFTTAGPWMQQKLFHAQPDPTLNEPESRRHNPDDPDQHLTWRSKNDEDYQPDECEHCGGDLKAKRKHAEQHQQWLENQDWHTDWNEDDLPGTLHRGIGVELPDEVHQRVHDESLPVHERARALTDHLLAGGSDSSKLGNFWSAEPDVSKTYAESATRRYGRHNDQTPVMFHIRTPPMEHIETDPDTLREWGVYSYHLAGNREVPIQHGAPLHSTGISWAPPRHGHIIDSTPEHLHEDPAWTHHDFGEGGEIRAQAAAEIVAHFDDDDDDEPHEEFEDPERGNRDEETGLYHHPAKGWHCHVCQDFHGEPDEVEDHDTGHTDWDEEYPRLPAEMHRGLALDDGSHGRDLHYYRDPSHDPASAAQGILHHLGDLGSHWTPSEDQARHYSVVGVGGRRAEGHDMNVVVHARKPGREDIETDPWKLSEQGVFGMGYHDDQEIPLRAGAPVHVSGVSWKYHDEPDSAWRRHDFGDRAAHTAAVEYGPKPEFVAAPEHLSDDEKMAHFDEQRKIKDDWEGNTRHGLSMGHLTYDRARKLGYWGNGDELPDEGWDNEGNLKWRRGWQALPQHLYHVTTNLPAVRESGGLKNRRELEQHRSGGLGLGGGPDDTISLTGDHGAARNILRAMHEYHDVLNGRRSPHDMVEEARTGRGAQRPFLHEWNVFSGEAHQREGDDLARPIRDALEGQESHTNPTLRTRQDMEEQEGPGWEPEDEGRDFAGHHVHNGPWHRTPAPERRRQQLSDLYKNFAWARQHAGGHDNPLFVSNDVERFAHLNPSHFAIVHATPRPGAQGFPESSLGEWRTASGDAVHVHRAERLEGGHLKEAALIHGDDEGLPAATAAVAMIGGTPPPWEGMGEDRPPVGPWPGGKAFHGTRSILEPGETLTSDEAERHPAHPMAGGISEGHVHITPHGAEAQYWAEHASSHTTHTRMQELGRGRTFSPGYNQDHAYPPRVYEVEPTGPVEPDPMGEGNSYRTAHPVRVVRQVRPLECWDCPDGGGTPEHWPDHPHHEYLQSMEDDDDDEGHSREAALTTGPDQPSAREERSDRWHELRGRNSDDLHRGIYVHLPSDLHAYVHDEGEPREDRARALREHFSADGLGMHWTPALNIASRAVGNAADDDDGGHNGDGTGVIFHVKRPGERNRLRNPEQLEEHSIGWRYSQDEDEFPLKPGSPLRLSGISWKRHDPQCPLEPYEHADFGRPFRHVSTRVGEPMPGAVTVAALSATASDDDGETWRHLQEGHGVNGAKTPGASFMNDLHDRFHSGQIADPRRVPHAHDDLAGRPASGQSARDDISRMFTPIPAEELEEQRREREPKPERVDDREYSINDVSRHYDWEGFDSHEIEHLVRHPERAAFTREDVPVHSLRHIDEHGQLVAPPSYRDIAGQGEDERGRLEELERGYDQGDHVPPIVAVRDGEHHIIADGSHRAAVHAERGSTHIPAFVTQRTIFPEQRREASQHVAYDWETDEGPYTWSEIAQRHPRVYGDDEDHVPGMGEGGGHDIADAAAELYHDRPSEPYSQSTGELHPENNDEMEFHPRTVDPSRIDYMRAEPGDQRVARARKGYESQHPEHVPPLILVHRHGVFQVADGAHRAGGADQARKPVRAYVAYSPHEDEPFAGRDGEPPARGPFHGAETEERPPMADQNGIPRRVSYPGFPHTADVPRPIAREAALEATAVIEEECPHCGGPAHAGGLVFGDCCPGEADESWQDDAGRGLTRSYVPEPTDEDSLRSHMVSHGPRWDNPAAPADWLSQVHNRLHSHGEGVFHQHDLPGTGHDRVFGSRQSRKLVEHFEDRPGQIVYADVHDQVPALPAATAGSFAWPSFSVPEDREGLLEALSEMAALVGVLREELYALATRLGDESPLHPSVIDMLWEMAASCRTAQEDMGRLGISSPEGSWEEPGSGPKA